jgi:phosphoglycerate kinase
MPHIRKLDDLDLQGKRVLVRADLNVPMDGGTVTDATRVERFAPTVTLLREKGAAVVVMSHWGRPKGKKAPDMSLAPVTAVLAEAVGGAVTFVQDCIGAEAEAATAALQAGEVALLENVRFYAGEEANDDAFAQQLAKHGDIYVSDAFSSAHRAHASTHAVSKFLPTYAGPSMFAELEALQAALENPERPVAALVGGAKVSSKIDVLQHLVPRMNKLIIGGGMANTFLLALGKPIGKSLAEPDLIETAQQIIAQAKEVGCELVLPQDVVAASEFKAQASCLVLEAHMTPDDRMILDVGPVSVSQYETHLEECKTLLWNGPLGAFEMEPFGEGTFALARKAAELTKAGALVTVAGGGDTVAALNVAGVTDDFTYVSTAGGAFLEWMEGKKLPGVSVLMQD